MFIRPIDSAEISIHAPAKGATRYSGAGLLPIRGFQSTLPRRERPAGRLVQRPTAHDFNPRSREGSDFNSQKRSRQEKISIHAPAKGATAKITKTIPDDFRKINNCNNSFAHIYAKHNCKLDIR